MKEFMLDLLRQLFGTSKARWGKIEFSQLAISRMNEYGLTEKTLVNVFRFGVQKKPGMIVQKFHAYSVGIYYKHDFAKGVYVITTCWKAS